MYQVQTWTFPKVKGGYRPGVCHTVGDPSKARGAIRSALRSRAWSEVIVWYPDRRTVRQWTRPTPDAPWRRVK